MIVPGDCAFCLKDRQLDCMVIMRINLAWTSCWPVMLATLVLLLSMPHLGRPKGLGRQAGRLQWWFLCRSIIGSHLWEVGLWLVKSFTQLCLNWMISEYEDAIELAITWHGPPWLYSMSTFSPSMPELTVQTLCKLTVRCVRQSPDHFRLRPGKSLDSSQ